MERFKAFEAAPQNFLIGEALFRPTFKHAVDSDALVPPELAVIEIGVVNHFANLLEVFVLNSKTLGQRFERAIVALMREIRIKHIE
jgi:hypothetical protein